MEQYAMFMVGVNLILLRYQCPTYWIIDLIQSNQNVSRFESVYILMTSFWNLYGDEENLEWLPR